LEQESFQRELAALMTEFIGSPAATKFLGKGERAHLIADSQIDIDDQPDFWRRFHERFSIKPPWESDPKPTTTLGRLKEAFFPSTIYELPDVTVGYLRQLVEDGAWPQGTVVISRPKVR
jgi:hypothetical protein